MAWSNFACFGTWYKGKHYVLFCGWRPRLSLLLVRCSHIVWSCSSFILILSLYMPWFIYPWRCWQGLGEISSLGFYFGKTYSSPPLCFFFFFHFWHVWSPDVWDFSPHQGTSYDTSWMPYNYIHFWHKLFGDSVTSHTWRSLSHNAVPHFRCQSQVLGPQVTHSFCPTWLQTGGSHPFFLLWFDYLLE